MEIIDVELYENENNDDNNDKEIDNLKTLIIDGDTTFSSSDELSTDENNYKMSPFFSNNNI